MSKLEFEPRSCDSMVSILSTKSHCAVNLPNYQRQKGYSQFLHQKPSLGTVTDLSTPPIFLAKPLKEMFTFSMPVPDPMAV